MDNTQLPPTSLAPIPPAAPPDNPLCPSSSLRLHQQAPVISTPPIVSASSVEPHSISQLSNPQIAISSTPIDATSNHESALQVPVPLSKSSSLTALSSYIFGGSPDEDDAQSLGISRPPSVSLNETSTSLFSSLSSPFSASSSSSASSPANLSQDKFRSIYLQSIQPFKFRGELTPRIRWENAIACVIRIVRALSTFRAPPPSQPKPSPPPSPPLPSANARKASKPTGISLLEFKLSDYTRAQVLMANLEMCKELDKPHHFYTDKNIELIRKITDRMESFQKYAPEMREKLLHCLQYCCYKPNSIILKQGHLPRAFYFIISGTTQVFRTENGVELTLSELHPGDSFGELALLKNARRTASVKCKTVVEMFSLDKDDFHDVLRTTTEEDQTQKIDFLKGLPMLADTSITTLLRLAEVCVKQERATNVVLMREREPIHDVYVLRKGSVRLVKILPFRKCPQGPGKYTLQQASMDRPTPDTIYRLVCVGALGPGSFFGQECLTESDPRALLPSLSQNSSSLSAAASANPLFPPAIKESSVPSIALLTLHPQNSYASFTSSKTSSAPFGNSYAYSPSTGNYQSHHSAPTNSVYSVITCEPTEIFKISKIDFMKLLPSHQIQALRDSQTDLSTLQQGYIDTLHWLNWKQAVLRRLKEESKIQREATTFARSSVEPKKSRKKKWRKNLKNRKGMAETNLPQIFQSATSVENSYYQANRKTP